MGSSYSSLITSEHNLREKFMAQVGAVAGAIGSITAGIQAIQPAFDLDQAVGAQLDVLGLWIGQSRIIPNVLLLGYFGFSELATGLPDGAQLPFGELTDVSKGGRFYELGEAYAGTTVLLDPDYLTILKARIVRNQSDGTLADFEAALAYIFGVPSSVVDGGTLSLALHVATPVTPTVQALLSTLDLLPRPAGVAIGAITYPP
jgi:hypothetical protein